MNNLKSASYAHNYNHKNQQNKSPQILSHQRIEVDYHPRYKCGLIQILPALIKSHPYCSAPSAVRRCGLSVTTRGENQLLAEQKNNPRILAVLGF